MEMLCNFFHGGEFMDYRHITNFRENWDKWGIIFQVKMKENNNPLFVRGKWAKSLGLGRRRLTPVSIPSTSVN